jgi:hypothetical protein
MFAKLIGILMLILGVLLSFDLAGSVLWSALELAMLLAKLLVSFGIAYIGYRLVTGPKPVSS